MPCVENNINKEDSVVVVNSDGEIIGQVTKIENISLALGNMSIEILLDKDKLKGNT